MEPIRTMQTATALLTVSAVGGLTMAIMRFSGNPYPPTWLAMLHGFLSATALTLLDYADFAVGLPGMAQVSLVLLLFATAGGAFINLNFHWQMLPLPKSTVLAHGGIAVCGFLLPAVATWKVSHA